MDDIKLIQSLVQISSNKAVFVAMFLRSYSQPITKPNIEAVLKIMEDIRGKVA